MEHLRSLDRRGWLVTIVLVPLLWWGPGLLWPYRHVVNLAAPGDLVVVLGDSVPAGFGDGVGVEKAWPTLVAQRLGLHLENESVPGDTTERAMTRLDKALAGHPRLVIVELGGNDMLAHVAPETMKAHLDAIFERIQKGGAMIVYASVPTPLRGQYESAWVASCREHGAWYVRDVLSGVFGSPRLMYDSIHPNAEGHEIIAQRMSGEISALLKAADRARGR
mgnify:CR=1 FL=1